MKFVNENNRTEMVIEWAEIVSLYRQYLRGEKIATRDRFQETIKDWQNGSSKSFSGNTGEEMLEFLDMGYEFPKQIDADLLPVVASYKKRARYKDDPEGEYSHDLYQMGEPDHFLTMPKRHNLIGIRMNVEYCFLANVRAEVIGEYAQWVGGVIQALQNKGYDLEIMLSCRSVGSYNEVKTNHIDMRVSRFGERVMPHDWSAIFTPGGFRHFFFTCIYLGAELKPELTTSYGLGTVANRRESYDINWEPKKREITISVNPYGNSFPAEAMTNKFKSWTE